LNVALHISGPNAVPNDPGFGPLMVPVLVNLRAFATVTPAESVRSVTDRVNDMLLIARSSLSFDRSVEL